MTATEQKYLLEEIRDSGALDARTLEAFGVVFSMLTLALAAIEDPATAHDYGIVLENLMDALVGPDASQMPYDFREQPRPETTDDRLLYQRIEDSGAARAVRVGWSKLNMMPLAISDHTLALRFLETVVAPFARGLGIPTAEEQKADPEKFPKVGRNAVVERLLEQARGSKPQSDLSNDYKLSL